MNIKVGIVVTTHYSDEYRPIGADLIQNYCQSTSYIDYPFTLYIFDNASIKPLPKLDYDYVKIKKVKDQTIRGLSGTWNDGTMQAINDDCNIIILSNDDVELNETINNFIEEISNHKYNENSIYGPVSNGLLGGAQLHNAPTNTIQELTGNKSNMLNGFFFGFTNKFYYNYKMENNYLFNEWKCPWGGNEEEFQKRIWSSNGKSFILGSCFISHQKIRGWVKLYKENMHA